MADLWEGARRLPYFFTRSRPGGDPWILCPQCALEQIEKLPQSLRAFYALNRQVMCARCGILIGPMNDEEMVEYE